MTITPIRIEYNDYNGLIVKLLYLECIGRKKGFEGSLFGLNVSDRFLIISILYFNIEIKSPIS